MSIKEYRHITKSLAPIYDEFSEILILGSIPSEKSFEEGFYYGNPQNRFWQVLAMMFECRTPIGREEKTAFLHSHRIALWDVIASCDIRGSSDQSVKNVVPNDVKTLISKTNIKSVFVHGRLAESLYNKFILPQSGVKASYLPQTSPLNASYDCIKLAKVWSEIIFGQNNKNRAVE